MAFVVAALAAFMACFPQTPFDFSSSGEDLSSGQFSITNNSIFELKNFDLYVGLFYARSDTGFSSDRVSNHPRFIGNIYRGEKITATVGFLAKPYQIVRELFQKDIDFNEQDLEKEWVRADLCIFFTYDYMGLPQKRFKGFYVSKIDHVDYWSQSDNACTERNKKYLEINREDYIDCRKNYGDNESKIARCSYEKHKNHNLEDAH